MEKHTLFIADLHLDQNEPKTAELFFHFLQNQAIHADALYILGDLFESWVGDDDLTPFCLSIIDQIKLYSQKNIPVYLMNGNRDFLIGKNFAQATGSRLISEPYCLSLYGKSVLLLHGDSLCTLDKKHLFFRKLTHNNLLRMLFLKLPLRLRKKIAHKLRNNSKQHTSQTPEFIMDVTEEAVVDHMKKYQVSHLIHGHTHLPKLHEVFLGEKQQGERIVLGAWYEKGCALKWYENGEKELIYF